MHIGDFIFDLVKAVVVLGFWFMVLVYIWTYDEMKEGGRK